MTRGRALGRLGAVVTALASGACVAILGLDPLSEKPGASSSDAAAEAGPCTLDDIGLPTKPAAAGQPTGDAGSAYFALNELDLGIDPGAGPPGFDLDHRVTADLASNGCTFPDASDPQAALQYGLDPPDSGIDNTTSQLLQLLAVEVSGFAPASINQRLLDRQFGYVLGVVDWNGAPDDDRVSVLAFPAIGYWVTGADGGLVPGPVPPGAPIDAGDLWMPDQRFAAASRGSILISAEAWVRAGQLVARFEKLTVPFRTSSNELRPFDLELHDGWLTGTLVAGGGGGADRPSLTHGRIGGRVSASDLARQIGFLFDLDSQTYLCAGKDSVAGIAVDVGCRARDIRSSHCDDGKGLPCDSLSFGARFETYAVDSLGPPRQPADAEYTTSTGRLPPKERCKDIVDSGLDCPP